MIRYCARCHKLDNVTSLEGHTLDTWLRDIGGKRVTWDDVYEKFKYCPKFNETLYCSRGCQLGDWPDHKLMCHLLVDCSAAGCANCLMKANNERDRRLKQKIQLKRKSKK